MFGQHLLGTSWGLGNVRCSGVCGPPLSVYVLVALEVVDIACLPLEMDLAQPLPWSPVSRAYLSSQKAFLWQSPSLSIFPFLYNAIRLPLELAFIP